MTLNIMDKDSNESKLDVRLRESSHRSEKRESSQTRKSKRVPSPDKKMESQTEYNVKNKKFGLKNNTNRITSGDDLRVVETTPKKKPNRNEGREASQSYTSLMDNQKLLNSEDFECSNAKVQKLREKKYNEILCEIEKLKMQKFKAYDQLYNAEYVYKKDIAALTLRNENLQLQEKQHAVALKQTANSLTELGEQVFSYFKAKEDEISSLKILLRRVEDALEIIFSKLSSLENKNTYLQQCLSQKEKEYKQLEQKPTLGASKSDNYKDKGEIYASYSDFYDEYILVHDSKTKKRDFVKMIERIKILSQEKESFCNELKISFSKLSSLEKKINYLQQCLSQKEQDCRQLEQQQLTVNTSKSDNYKDLDRKYISISKDYDTLMRDHEIREKELQKLQDIVAQQAQEAKSLEKELATSKLCYQEAAQQNNELQDSINAIKTELASKVNEIEKLNDTSKKLHTDLAIKDRNCDELKFDNNRFQQQLKTSVSKKYLVDKEKEIEKLENTIKQLEGELDVECKKNSKLSLSNKNTKQNLEKSNNEIAKRDTENQKLKDEIRILKNNSLELEKLLSDKVKIISDFEMMNDKKLQELKMELDFENNKIIKDLKIDLQKKEKDLCTLNECVLVSENLINNLEKKIEEKTKECDVLVLMKKNMSQETSYKQKQQEKGDFLEIIKKMKTKVEDMEKNQINITLELDQKSSALNLKNTECATLQLEKKKLVQKLTSQVKPPAKHPSEGVLAAARNQVAQLEQTNKELETKHALLIKELQAARRDKDSQHRRHSTEIKKMQEDALTLYKSNTELQESIYKELETEKKKCRVLESHNKKLQTEFGRQQSTQNKLGGTQKR